MYPFFLGVQQVTCGGCLSCHNIRVVHALASSILYPSWSVVLENSFVESSLFIVGRGVSFCLLALALALLVWAEVDSVESIFR